MEVLACAANTRILLDTNVQQHFCSDAAIAAFWQKPQEEIRAAFGDICDITQLKTSDNGDDGTGCAAHFLVAWLAGWLDNLRREAHSA